MNFVFNSNEDVKPEVKNEVWLQNIDDVTSDFSQIEEETSEAELDTYANEADDTCKIQIKSEAHDDECDASFSDNSMKLELLHEELEIKTDINHEEQTSDLHEHDPLHLGKKICKCDICIFTSIYKQSLKRHMTIHTGEKPFKCGLCSYASAFKNDLESHTKTHTGEKPFNAMYVVMQVYGRTTWAII